MAQMKAYRKVGNGYREIDIDLDDEGVPLLPPDTTIDPIPADKPGYQWTVEGTSWVPVELPKTPEPTFEETMADFKVMFSEWKVQFLNAPYIYDNKVMDGDAVSRERILGAMQALQVFDETPAAWVTFDKQMVAPVSKEWLTGLSRMSYTKFQERFATATLNEQALFKCETMEDLEKIKLPDPDNYPALMDIITGPVTE